MVWVSANICGLYRSKSEDTVTKNMNSLLGKQLWIPTESQNLLQEPFISSKKNIQQWKQRGYS